MASTPSDEPHATKLEQILPVRSHKIDKNTTITLEQYTQQLARWPTLGHHILGTFSDTAILVYQAFNHQIADYAVREQKFEGAPGFSSTRMTWIKPNFLWMMYRSNWGTSPNQERILGIWLKLEAFHELLMLSEQTSANSRYASKEEYEAARKAVKKIPGMEGFDWQGRVNIQWDPDHTPSGGKLRRRAIQIGIKMVPWWATGERFERIVDMSDFVASQRPYSQSDAETPSPELYTPQEFIYVVPDEAIAAHAAVETTPADKQHEVDFMAANFCKK